jgi:hypothetical protein
MRMSDGPALPDEEPPIVPFGPDASSTDPARRYRADAFTLPLPAGDWTDRSLYVLTGPTCDGLVHSITVVREAGESRSRDERAQQNVEAVRAELGEARVLRRDDVPLDCGRSAHRAIFVWFPAEGRRYLEQLYVRDGATHYTLSAVFTRHSRRRIGAEVERVMRSFAPTS